MDVFASNKNTYGYTIVGKAQISNFNLLTGIISTFIKDVENAVSPSVDQLKKDQNSKDVTAIEKDLNILLAQLSHLLVDALEIADSICTNQTQMINNGLSSHIDEIKKLQTQLIAGNVDKPFVIVPSDFSKKPSENPTIVSTNIAKPIIQFEDLYKNTASKTTLLLKSYKRKN